MMIEIKVVTNAKRREIVDEGSRLKVKVTSLPHDGKANEELTEFLASSLRIRKTDIRIVRGEKDRRKLVSLPIEDDELRERLRSGKAP